MIPRTYKEWHHCIVNECGIPLTQEYIQQRLDVLNNNTHQETRRLVSLYGQAHLAKLIEWFSAAAQMSHAGQGDTVINNLH